jgi:molybdenum cofactor cytidylyltransferase
LISGVILAAGTSSRLGRPKQLLELRGKPVLQSSIDRAAAASMDEIVIVLGHEAARIRAAVHLPSMARTIVNHDYASGQASSLSAGLAAVDQRAEAAVVLLGDQPQADPRAVGALVEAWRRATQPVARAVYRGIPGHPVVIGRAAFSDFESAGGDDGGRAVLGRLEVCEVDFDAPPPADIDTWEQYEAARRGH